MADDEGFTFDYLIARSSNRSRFWLAFRFFSRNSPFVAGIFECFGQKCQKQPSTNTATRSLGNTKSGFPNTGRFLRHPVISSSWNTAINASSVARFPLLRIRAFSPRNHIGLRIPGAIAPGWYRPRRWRFRKEAIPAAGEWC